MVFTGPTGSTYAMIGFKTNWNSAVDEHKKLHTNELRKYQKYQRLRIKKREEN